MKNSPYFKHDATAFANEKLMQLVQEEGLKGYGAYWLILECLRIQSKFTASFQILETLSYRSRTKVGYFKHIVEDFGLFVVENETFYSVGMQTRLRSFLERQNAVEVAKKSVNRDASSLEDSMVSLPNARKEEKSREEEEKKSSKKEMPFWERWVDTMNQDQTWMELIAMHSGTGELFMKHRAEVLELFKEHARRFDNARRLLSEHDVRQYFANCFSQGTRVGGLMRDKIRKLDAQAREKYIISPYEECKDGKRMYLGRIIPDDAPPRPDAYAVFDEGQRVWHR